MVFAGLVIGIRRRLDDMSSRAFSIEDVTQAIDEAAKFLQGEAGPLMNRTSLSLVKNQRQYALAAGVQKVRELEFFDSSGGHKVYEEDLDRFRENARIIRRASNPELYVTLETERVILLNPIPDTAAGTTTINQAGGISATATSVTVVSTTGFPTEGRIIIDSEVMSYTNTTATTFAGMVRALEGTAAATHANSATITERDLFVYGDRLYRDLEMRTYYTTGTVTMTNASATVTGASTAWTNNIAAGDFLGQTANVTTTMPIKWYEISTVDSATQVTLVDTWAEPNQSAVSYIVSNPNPFPNYCDSFLIAYSISQLIKKTGQYDRANLEFASAMRHLSNLKANQLKSDRVIVPGSLATQGVGSRMPVWLGEYHLH